MFEFLIKFTNQISAVIDYFSLIIVHILTIEKNLNCLPSLSISSCFSQCRKGHTCLKFHKFIICSIIRTEFSMLLLMIAMTISFPRVSFTISLISYITSSALTLILDFITERRNLKASLISIQIKRKASKKGRFRDKSSSSAKHC